MSGYALDQCALYKVRSKRRLVEILQISMGSLARIDRATEPYRIFDLPDAVCEFTGNVVKARQVEEPKPELKRIHDRVRRLLSGVLLVDYAHAAVRGRSYRTNAEVHKSSDVVATFDIQRFYPSTSEAHVVRFFARNMKCSPDVAAILGKLLCYRSVPGVGGCLPTGSPASPIVSIYANKPMFDAMDRLAKIARIRFTCYVDDLTFSGSQLPPNLERRIKSIVAAGGHQINSAKTKFFASGIAKHVTGVVLKNGVVAVPHQRFLKARRIEEAIRSSEDFGEQLRLSRKLSGLLGEAAYLDESFSVWASASYRNLNALSKAPALTQDGKVIRLDEDYKKNQKETD